MRLPLFGCLVLGASLSLALPSQLLPNPPAASRSTNEPARLHTEVAATPSATPTAIKAFDGGSLMCRAGNPNVWPITPGDPKYYMAQSSIKVMIKNFVCANMNGGFKDKINTLAPTESWSQNWVYTVSGGMTYQFGFSFTNRDGCDRSFANSEDVCFDTMIKPAWECNSDITGRYTNLGGDFWDNCLTMKLHMAESSSPSSEGTHSLPAPHSTVPSTSTPLSPSLTSNLSKASGSTAHGGSASSTGSSASTGSASSTGSISSGSTSRSRSATPSRSSTSSTPYTLSRSSTRRRTTSTSSSATESKTTPTSTGEATPTPTVVFQRDGGELTCINENADAYNVTPHSYIKIAEAQDLIRKSCQKDTGFWYKSRNEIVDPNNGYWSYVMIVKSEFEGAEQRERRYGFEVTWDEKQGSKDCDNKVLGDPAECSRSFNKALVDCDGAGTGSKLGLGGSFKKGCMEWSIHSM